MPDDALHIRPGLSLPPDELVFRFSRSSGPGGQHVNRAESRVELCFDARRSPALRAALGEAGHARLLDALAGRMDGSGVLRLVVQAHRSQFQNRQLARRRLRALLRRALRPAKTRKPTRPTRAARERRLRDKRARSEKKRLRRRPEE
jgi:ribosome-associated protein